MLESLRNKKIMVVVAHPDDEVLGLGGTINKLISSYNCSVRSVILGEGITARTAERNTDVCAQELQTHRQNIYLAQAAIGYQSVGIYDLPDNRFDSVDLLNIVKLVENEKKEFCPEVIFTHHGGDVNIDHQRTFESVITACRPVSGEVVHTIISFETFSGTEWMASTDPRHFIPNFFVSLDASHIVAKVKAMEAYEFEKRIYPHPRSPEALEIVAKRWGIVIGSSYAEAFTIVRTIN